MSHPDPHGPPDLTPIAVGEVFEDPVTRERSVIVERPWDNPEGLDFRDDGARWVAGCGGTLPPRSCRAFAAPGGPACDLRCGGSDRTLARLSRDVPADFPHRARAADVSGKR